MSDGAAVSHPPSASSPVRSLTPWQHAWRRFRKNRLGVIGAVVLVILYVIALFAGFLSPYAIETQHASNSFQPPQRLHFIHEGQLRWPFVYPTTFERDPVTFIKEYVEDTKTPEPLRLFHRGEEYNLLGIKTDIHLFGVANGFFFPLGTDKLGRCLFSRMLVGSQVSLTVGIIGIIISFTIGIIVGGVSGYYGGWVDTTLQRLVEVVLSFPRLPLLLAMAFVIPSNWPSSYVYLGIVAVLALVGWGGLARVVRGQVLAARQLEYVQAARALGASDWRVILRHIVPNLTSFLIVSATLALPGYILGESALSFLGVGVKEPMTSWGLLLKEATSETLAVAPWLLFPGGMIVLAVLAFNFAGDAMRDAADVQSRM